MMRMISHLLLVCLQEWVESIGLGQYAPVLADHGFDCLDTIAAMNETLLRDMAQCAGMMMGHTTKLIVAQAALRAQLSLP